MKGRGEKTVGERTRWKEENLEIMPRNGQLSVRKSKSSHDQILGMTAI
jgi:hypothetical protein